MQSLSNCSFESSSFSELPWFLIQVAFRVPQFLFLFLPSVSERHQNTYTQGVWLSKWWKTNANHQSHGSLTGNWDNEIVIILMQIKKQTNTQTNKTSYLTSLNNSKRKNLGLKTEEWLKVSSLRKVVSSEVRGVRQS